MSTPRKAFSWRPEHFFSFFYRFLSFIDGEFQIADSRICKSARPLRSALQSVLLLYLSDYNDLPAIRRKISKFCAESQIAIAHCRPTRTNSKRTVTVTKCLVKFHMIQCPESRHRWLSQLLRSEEVKVPISPHPKC